VENARPFFAESSSVFPHRDLFGTRYERGFWPTLELSTLFGPTATGLTRRL
jgi:hypothetical protein